MQRLFEGLFDLIDMVFLAAAALITIAACVALPVLGSLFIAAALACYLMDGGWSEKAANGAAAAIAIAHCLAWLYVVERLL